MKRKLRIFLLMMALPVLLVCTAFATDVVTEGIQTAGRTTANPGCTVTYDAATGKYTASTTSGIKAGKEYVLLVVKADGNGNALPINDESVMYIDQKAADANGVSFDFIPRSTPDCVVKLGGEFSEGTSPVTLGTLVGKSGVTVSGSVSYQTSNTPATVTIYSGGTEVASTTTNASGAYTFNAIPIANDYRIVVTKPSYCKYTLTRVDVATETTVPNIDISGLAGDVNGNDEINVNDLTPLLNQFNKSGNQITDVGTDINRNDEVNVSDLTMLLNNFNKKAVTAAK